MTVANSETFKASWIADIKANPLTIAPILPEEVREVEYQSTDWVYPCVRVSVEFRPSINRCGPDDADIKIIVYSAEKSSKQSVHIASLLQGIYHGHPFTKDNIQFCTVIVRNVEKPMRSIYAWETTINIFCQGYAV